MDPALRLVDVPVGSRESFGPILDESFDRIYLWHARRVLRSVTWVRGAASGDAPAGLSMSEMLGPATGYIFYIAVSPSLRGKGVGGLLLDDALQLLRRAGASEVLACVRPENTASLRLFQARGFRETGFRELVRSKGLAGAARLWVRMVAAPGERVLVSR